MKGYILVEGRGEEKAAERLDTSLRIINYKIHNYGIDPKQYKVK